MSEISQETFLTLTLWHPSCASRRVYNQDRHKDGSHEDDVDSDARNNRHSLRLRCAMAEMAFRHGCNDFVAEEAEENNAGRKQAESRKDEPRRMTPACLVLGVGLAFDTQQTRRVSVRNGVLRWSRVDADAGV